MFMSVDSTYMPAFDSNYFYYRPWTLSNIMQGFPSGLYFKSPWDPHKKFLRVQGQKSRVFNHQIFLKHIQIKIKIVLICSVKVIPKYIS